MCQVVGPLPVCQVVGLLPVCQVVGPFLEFRLLAQESSFEGDVSNRH